MHPNNEMKRLSTYATLAFTALLLLGATAICPQSATAAAETRSGAASEALAEAQGATLSASQDRRQARLFDRHTVRMGETAYSISRGYGLSPRTLAEDNPTVDITRIRPGQTLLIRKRERGRTEPDEVAREWADMSGAVGGGASGAGGDPARETLFDRYTVRPGETAYSIARARGLSPQTLAEDNPGVDITKIGAGQTLLVRRSTEPATATGGWIDLSGGTVGGAVGETSGAADLQGDPLDTSFPRRGARTAGDFSAGGTPRIALMLPLSGGATDDFAEFCNGALVALEALKAEGHSASLTIYDSERSAAKVRSIVTSAEFADTDLIIGPVLEQELEPAVRFGERMGIPVVSPLASVGSVEGPTLYQMAPDATAKYDKLRPLLAGDVNIIVVSSGAADDAEFAAEMNTLLRGRAVRRFAVDGGNFVSLVDWERPNVLVVLGGTQTAVDTALKTVSSSYNHASATRSRRARIDVVGSSKWAFYNTTTNLTELMFKLNTHFVTNYYVNRWNTPTRLFEARYLELHAGFPSRAAFRGYDAVALFAGALFRRGATFADRLAGMTASDAFVGAGTTSDIGEAVGTGGDATGVAMPLGTPYRFVRGSGTILFGMHGGEGTMRGGRYTNDQWTLVSFTDDFNVTAR